MAIEVVIMAGGKGTRIASVDSTVPKPMIPVCGKPVLEHLIESLVRQGYVRLTLVTGHLGHVIQDYFKDGTDFGADISYYHEEAPLGTAGALIDMKNKLDDSFLLLNGDNIIDMDFNRLMAFHRNRNALATLAAHPNSHPYDSALLVCDEEDRVVRWYTKEEERPACRNLVNAGVHVLSAKLLENFSAVEKLDLDRRVLKPSIDTGRIFAYKTPEYIMDMGTPERLEQVNQDYVNGVVQARNLSNPQRAVFLDRDGTINQYRGFITNPDQIELEPGAAQAIRSINCAGLLAIVVTNQPVIARGDCSLERLEAIHCELESQLGAQGAYLNDIFFCPHHPDKGFEGEIAELKIDCSCRKPKPGMLLMAAKKYNINLKESWMVGDSLCDIEAGEAAGCKTFFVGKDTSLLDFVNNELDG